MKCLKCNAESNGRYCEICGSRMPEMPPENPNPNLNPNPQYPVCTNCGAEVNGRFCIKCGNPVELPPEPEFKPEIQPEQTAQPVPENSAPFNRDNSFSSKPHNDRYTSKYSNQYTRSQSKYSGRKFDNEVAQNPEPKAGSQNKTAVIIISIIIVLIIALIGIFGFVACSMIKSASDAISNEGNENFFESIFGEFEDEGIVDEDFDVDIDFDVDVNDDYYFREILERETGDNPYAKGDAFIKDSGYYNKETNYYYIMNEDNTGVSILGFNQFTENFINDAKDITINIPEKINELPVVHISSLYLFNYNMQDGEQNIKVIIPGSVKTISTCALSFNYYVDEIVIEDGVKNIGYNAFYSCSALKKIHIPKSVKSLDESGLGYTSADDVFDEFTEDLPIIGLEIYGKKGSEAETYAKENGFIFIEE